MMLVVTGIVKMCKAPVRAPPPPHTDTQKFFYRPDALPTSSVRELKV